MSDVVDAFFGGVGDAAALLAMIWLVAVGGVGAAIGQQCGRPVLGAVVSIVLPIPVVNWLIAYAVVSQSGRAGLRARDDEIFSDLL